MNFLVHGFCETLNILFVVRLNQGFLFLETVFTLTDQRKPSCESFSDSLCIFLVVLANRLTVAVSDVLNPNIDDMSRGVGPLGYGTSQGDFSPQVSLHLPVIVSNC